MGRAWPCLIALAACGRIDFDELGSTGTTLQVDPPTSTINVGSKTTLTVSGGTPPYDFAVIGAGSLDATTFIAPNRAGQSSVEVTDAAGLTATATVAYRGDQLFLVGGFLGTAPTNTVLTSSDGVTWTMAGQLPAARGNGAVVVYDDRIFYLGGLNAASAATTEVYASNDGATWTQVGTLPLANTGFTATVHRGEIWFVGGATANGNGGTAYHSRDGATWTAAPSTLLVVRHESDLISRGDRLYVLGGHGDTQFLDDIVWTTDGSVWTTAPTTLTFAADFPAAGELGDRAFRTCGASCMSTETSLDLQSWLPGAPLPDGARDSPALVGFGGRMLLVGGGTTVLATTDASAWQIIGSLPQARARTGAVQFTPR